MYLRTNRARLATSQFSSALAADPFLWSAHQELCALGEGDAAVKLLAEAKCACVAAKVDAGLTRASSRSPAALFPPGDDGFATPASHDVAMGTPSGGATPRQARCGVFVARTLPPLTRAPLRASAASPRAAPPAAARGATWRWTRPARRRRRRL